MKFEESMLSAYLDGELNDEERRVVELQLRKDPSSRELLESLRNLQSALMSLPVEAFSEDPVVGVRKKIASGAKGGADRVAGDLAVAARRGAADHGERGNGMPRWLLPFTVAVAAALIGVVFYLPRFSFEVADRVRSESSGGGVFSGEASPAPQAPLADSPVITGDVSEAAPADMALAPDGVGGGLPGAPSELLSSEPGTRLKRSLPGEAAADSRGAGFGGAGLGGAVVGADSAAMPEPMESQSNALDVPLADAAVVDRSVAKSSAVPSLAVESGAFLEAPWGTRVGLDDLLIVSLPVDAAEPPRARESIGGVETGDAHRIRSSASEWVLVSVPDPRGIAAQCLAEQRRASGDADSKSDVGVQGDDLRAEGADQLSQVVERLIGGGVVAIEFRGTAEEFAGVLERLVRLAGADAIERGRIVLEPSIADADPEALSRVAEEPESAPNVPRWLLLELSGRAVPAPR